MKLVKWILLISSTIFVYCMVQLLLAYILKRRLNVETRLKKIQTDDIKKAQQETSSKKLRLSFLHISQSMKTEMNLAGIKLSPEEFVLAWILIAFGPAALSIVISPNIFRSIIIAVIGAILPLVYLRVAINKRRTLFERQLGDALMVLANALRAGFSFQQALANVANDLSDPIGKEFSAVCRELQIGVDVETALMKVVERMNSGDLKLITTAVVVQQQVGGNLSEILDTISQTIRDRLAIKRSIKTLTAQGRISGKIIGGIPLVLLIMITLVNPSYITPLFNTFVGKALLAAGAVMEVLGFIVINKIVNIKF